MGPSSTHASGHQCYVLCITPPRGLHGSFCCGGSDYHGCDGRQGWAPTMWRLPECWQPLYTAQGDLGLVLAYRWAGMGSGAAGYGAKLVNWGCDGDCYSCILSVFKVVSLISTISPTPAPEWDILTYYLGWVGQFWSLLLGHLYCNRFYSTGCTYLSPLGTPEIYIFLLIIIIIPTKL